MASKLRFTYYFRKYFIIFIKVIRISIIDTVRQDGIEHAGYLAFLGLVSFLPFLIILLSLANAIGIAEYGMSLLIDVIKPLPPSVQQNLKPLLAEVFSSPPQQFLTIAVFGIIWTASSSVEGLRTILNRAYRVHFPPPYFIRRIFSIVEFFIVTFVLLVAVLILAIFPLFIGFLLKSMPISSSFIFLFKLHNVTLLAMAIIANALLYFGLPNCKQKISQTIPGSVLVAFLLFFILKIFGYYLVHFKQFSLVYGSFGGIIGLLMVFYLFALAFIFGAEFNYHFHRVYKKFLKKTK